MKTKNAVLVVLLSVVFSGSSLGAAQKPSRGTRVPVTIETNGQSKGVQLNMRKPLSSDGFLSLGQYDLNEGEAVAVVLSTEKSGGAIQADAIQIIATDKLPE